MIQSVGDVVGWIVGGLAALAFYNYKTDKKSDNDKFKSLFDGQRSTEAKVVAIEVELKGIHAHFIQTLEDIKAQNSEMARDVTEIKIGLASIPKRHGDPD